MWSLSVLRSQVPGTASLVLVRLKQTILVGLVSWGFLNYQIRQLALLGPQSGSGRARLHITPNESTNSDVWRRERHGVELFSSIHYRRNLYVFFHTCSVKLKPMWQGCMSGYKWPYAGNTVLPCTRHPVRAQEPLKLAAQRANMSAVWKWKNRNIGWRK